MEEAEEVAKEARGRRRRRRSSWSRSRRRWGKGCADEAGLEQRVWECSRGDTGAVVAFVIKRAIKMGMVLFLIPLLPLAYIRFPARGWWVHNLDPCLVLILPRHLK